MAYRSDFPRICVALGCAEAEKLEKLARQACEDGEEFLEIRMDLLEDPAAGAAILRRLRQRYPDAYLLATCRRKPNGGQFRGSIAEQFRLLEAAVEAGVQAVDVELETAESAPDQVRALGERVKVILSYHNFEATPALHPIVRKLEKLPAHLYKLVTTAKKPSDNLRVLEALKPCGERHCVALAMGEMGVPSRVLSLARCAPFTFAAPAAEAGTAPGQLSSRLLRRQYRADRHTPETAVYGVIANPIGHSISPAVHNRALQARRVDAVYLPFLVEERQLSDFLGLAAALPVAGFSVTIPHKQKILGRLDGVDPAARRIGAVNTVYRRHGRLRGANTDVLGVTVPLEKRLKLKGSKILVVGNGGAARGAVFALLDKGAKVFLTGRNPDRVRALARVCGAAVVEREKAADQEFEVLVHATPLGMHPKPGESFFRDKIPAAVVFDMVYNPLETQLLKQARAAGKKTISGLEMFLEQAAAQFEIWTAQTAPRLAMEAAAKEVLGVRC
jgi:3-dehydroquinate dehydratase/shikimate dehydrogenase